MDNIHFLWQYALILSSSVSYLIYLVRFKPYKTPAWNRYMIITEAFYLHVVVSLFFFMVDFPPRDLRLLLAVSIMIVMVSITLTSLIMTIYLACKGPDALRQAEKESKLRRAEQEARMASESKVAG